MSTISRTFLGQKLDKDKFYSVQNVRMCDCVEITNNEPQYCPTCGCIWSRKIKTPRFNHEALRRMNPELVLLEHLDGKCFIAHDGCYALVGSAQNFTMIQLPNIELISNAIKTTLEPLDLWDKKRFGFWTVLSHE